MNKDIARWKFREEAWRDFQNAMRGKITELSIREVFETAYNTGWKTGRKRARREYFKSLLKTTKH